MTFSPSVCGRAELPPGHPPFKRHWRWDLFQAFNAATADILRHSPHDDAQSSGGGSVADIGLIDVVPMTRLRPPVGWKARPRKPLDCLHGDPAAAEWNELVVNVLASSLCESE